MELVDRELTATKFWLGLHAYRLLSIIDYHTDGFALRFTRGRQADHFMGLVSTSSPERVARTPQLSWLVNGSEVGLQQYPIFLLRRLPARSRCRSQTGRVYDWLD